MLEHSPITSFSVLSGILNEEGNADDGTLKKQRVDVLFFGHSDGIMTAIFHNNTVLNDVFLSEKRSYDIWCGRMHSEEICGIEGVPGENAFVSWSKHEIKSGLFDDSKEGEVTLKLDMSQHVKGYSIATVLIIERNIHLFTNNGRVMVIDLDNGNLVKQYELVVNTALCVEKVLHWEGSVEEYYILWDGNRISKHSNHGMGKFSQVKFEGGGKIAEIDISSDQQTMIASICKGDERKVCVFDISKLLSSNTVNNIKTYTTNNQKSDTGEVEVNNIVGIHCSENQNYCFGYSSGISWFSTHQNSYSKLPLVVMKRVFKLNDEKLVRMKWSTDATCCFLLGDHGSIVAFNTDPHQPEFSLAAADCIQFPIHKKFLDQKLNLFGFYESTEFSDIEMITQASSDDNSQLATKNSLLTLSSFDIFQTGKNDKSIARYIFGHEDGTFSLFAKETPSGPCKPLCCYQSIHSGKIIGFLKVSDNRYLSWTKKEIFVSDLLFKVVKDLSLHIKGENVIALEFFGTNVYIVTHMAKLKVVELRSDFKFVKCKEISLVTEGLSGLTVKTCQIVVNDNQIELLILWNSEKEYSIRTFQNTQSRIQNKDAPINVSLSNRITEIGKLDKCICLKYAGEDDYTILSISSIPDTLVKGPEFPKVPDYTLYSHPTLKTYYALTSEKFFSLFDSIRLEITIHDVRRTFKGFNERFSALQWCKGNESSAVYLLCSGGTVLVFDLTKDELNAPNLQHCKPLRIRLDETTKKMVLNKSVRVPKQPSFSFTKKQ